jgi:hypothetical protein
MPCVNEQTVQDLLVGRLHGDALAGVEHHVATCSSCAALIAAAARGTGSEDTNDAPGPPRPALVSKPSIAVGTVVGRFVVLEFLGAGGMGEVYAAYDPNLERKVAVKFLRPEFLGPGKQSVAADRMRREARLVAKLSHPNVVTVYEIDVFDGHLFIAMEYVDGQNVAEWLKAEARAVRDVVRVFLAAGAGLAAAHAAGVIHRDFKPHNVMIANGGEVRVMDFGLAHLDTEVEAPTSSAAISATAPTGGTSPAPETTAEREARLTRTGTLLGTPAYMAPEQLLGAKATTRTDQYSFCVALHEGLFGRRPVGPVGSRARTTGKMDAVVAEVATRSVPGWIRRALKRGLAADPAQRYASMDDLLADLRADKARQRKLALALVAGLAVVSGGTWGALHEVAARRVRFCRANVATAAAVWPVEAATPGAVPPGTPTSVWDAFQRSGVADATGTFERVSRTLSTYVAHWARSATDACEATHVRREQSREELALRMGCLDERLSAARALTGMLARADAKVVAHAADAALGLPDLGRCSELVLLRAVKPPDSADKQATVIRLRRRMAELKLLLETGHFESIAGDVETLERDIRAVGYPPLLVDFLQFVQSNLANVGVPTERTANVREALRVAQSAGYEEGIAEALVGLAWVEYRNPALSDVALEQARAVTQHLGNPVVLRAWIENDESFLLYARAHFAEALRHAERSLVLKEQRTPRDARDVAISESNICIILATSGRPNDALPHCDRSVELSVSVLGSSHPNVMNIAENRAAVLTELGRFDEGCRLADRVRAFFEGRGERIEGRVTLMPTLGRCAVNRGRPDEARRLLERGFAEATRTAATTMEIAELEWQLARAVYATGDHRRGLDLADSAAKRYATLPELAFRARDVHAWRAARRELDR